MRRPHPPYPDIENAATFSGGTLFRLRQPQLPSMPDRGVSDAATGASQRAFQDAPLGEPLADVDVRSTYDVRPLQAFDFNVTVSGDTTHTGEGGTLVATPVPFSVPIGYVAVVRAFNHSFAPVFPAVVRSDVLLTIRVQDADLPFNSNIPVGAQSQGLVNCFFICDEGWTFGARFTTTIVSPATFTVSLHAYGNLLRKTGRSAPLEIGNPVHKR